jgi:peptide/nickel transport system substrate-binding protein
MAKGIMDRPTRQFICPESVGPSGEVEDWKMSCGTGPFIWTDYVPGSAVTGERNPEYWGWDEKNPENQVPYVDRMKCLLIADRATIMSGLRTGKIDVEWSVTWEDADAIQRGRKDIMVKTTPRASSPVFKPRWDHEPFTDVRVRRALNLCIDREAIKETVWGGYGWMYTSMVYPAFANWYTEYEDLPENVTQWLVYDPDQAKELLAEAGYPNGFTTHIDTCEYYAAGYAEVFQAYLKDIGITAEIRTHERGAYNSLRYGKQHEQIILHWNSGYAEPLQLAGQWSDPAHKFNLACTNDPIFNEMYQETLTIFDEDILTQYRYDLDMYALENSFYVSFPRPAEFCVWQPWLKGFQG